MNCCSAAGSQWRAETAPCDRVAPLRLPCRQATRALVWVFRSGPSRPPTRKGPRSLSKGYEERDAQQWLAACRSIASCPAVCASAEMASSRFARLRGATTSLVARGSGAPPHREPAGATWRRPIPPLSAGASTSRTLLHHSEEQLGGSPPYPTRHRDSTAPGDPRCVLRSKREDQDAHRDEHGRMKWRTATAGSPLLAMSRSIAEHRARARGHFRPALARG